MTEEIKFKPWDWYDRNDLSYEPDEDFIIKEWSALKSSDFCFATTHSNLEKITIVYLVPEEYYETNGLMFAHSIPFQDLPPYMVEILECVFEVPDEKASHEKICYDLKTLGFKYNRLFQTFVEKNSSFNREP